MNDGCGRIPPHRVQYSNEAHTIRVLGLQVKLPVCGQSSLGVLNKARLTQKKRRRNTSMLRRLATTATPAAMKKKSPAAA